MLERALSIGKRKHGALTWVPTVLCCAWTRSCPDSLLGWHEGTQGPPSLSSFGVAKLGAGPRQAQECRGTDSNTRQAQLQRLGICTLQTSSPQTHGLGRNSTAVPRLHHDTGTSGEQPCGWVQRAVPEGLGTSRPRGAAGSEAAWGVCKRSWTRPPYTWAAGTVAGFGRVTWRFLT